MGHPRKYMDTMDSIGFHEISWDFFLEHMEEEMSMGASWDFMIILLDRYNVRPPFDS